MPNLLVEIGNTALKAAWSEGMTLGKTFRYQGEKMFGFRICGILIIIDRNHTATAISNNIPEYISPDRIASVVAARYLFKGKGSIVFDFGTTLSIDLIDPEGVYEGGNISLGCRTRFKALNRYSRSLPLVDTPTTVNPTGDSLISSIESGVIGGIMFEIQGYLSQFPEKTAVFTGGDALYFAKRMKNSIFVVCNLVLMGLAIIADNYAERND